VLFVGQIQSSHSLRYAGCMPSTSTKCVECRWDLWRHRGAVRTSKLGRRPTAFMPATCHLMEDKSRYSICTPCFQKKNGTSAFNDLILLVGRQEGHPACKKLDIRMLVVTIRLCYSSSCHHHLHHPCSHKSLVFWYWLTHVVLTNGY